MAIAGALSNSELTHGTRYGLYGYVEVYTVLQPVAAMIPHWSPYLAPVAAHIIRSAVPSPQPAHDPAPPTYTCVCSLSIMSTSRFSLMYRSSLGPTCLNNRCDLRIRSITGSVFGIIFSALSSHTVTHSAQPLHFDGSIMMANRPPGSPFFCGPS